jgi:hypothetical protein
MAGCGGLIGVALAAWLRPGGDEPVKPRSTDWGGGYLLLWILAFAGWCGVLMIVFWYPFDFNTEWGFVHTRIAELKRVPFEAYYFGTELRAVTEVFHKTGFFFPIGAILAIGVAGIRRRWAVPLVLLHAASVLIMAGVAAGIEIGQVFLPTKIADTTDWFPDARRSPGICLPADVAPSLANRTRERSVAPHGKRNEMDVAMSSTVSPAAPLQLERLMALSIAVLAWFVCAGLLAVGPPVPPAGEMVETGDLPFRPSHLLIPFFAGCGQSSSAVLPAGSACAIQQLLGWLDRRRRGVLIPDRAACAPRGQLDLVMQQAGLWSASRVHGSVRQPLRVGWSFG